MGCDMADEKKLTGKWDEFVQVFDVQYVLETVRAMKKA